MHIPFCHSKCAYCDFYSKPCRTDALMQEYADALIAEYDMRIAEEPPVSARTIYFGGGTPSIMPPALLERLLCRFAAGEDSVDEATIEVNPEDVTHENAAAWLRAGFNRVSMGVQSLIDSELSAIGRRHSARQAITAVETLRNAGFGNISLDVIYGLPGQTLDTFGRTLEGILALAPEHLSAYILSYEHGTRLNAMLRAGRIEATDEDTIVEMYTLLTRRCAESGYSHYEISNFCKRGHRALHNSSYWDGTPYLGLGPGAHSYDGTARRANPHDLAGYLAGIKAGRTVCIIEDETDDDRMNDMLITALRTSEGLDLHRVAPHRLHALLESAAPWIDKGVLRHEEGRLWIPERHWLVADAVMRDLMV